MNGWRGPRIQPTKPERKATATMIVALLSPRNLRVYRATRQGHHEARASSRTSVNVWENNRHYE
jgi:hypothetical protein